MEAHGPSTTEGEASLATLSALARLPDRELAARHAYGDPEAFDQVYERYSEMVHRMASRMAGDPALAEDLSQEIFIRIYRHLDRFRGRSSLKTWIYRVAVNCCRSRLGRRSKRGRNRVDVEETFFDSVVSTEAGTDARLRRREAGERLQRGLARLPVNFREAVVLRDVCDLSYEEIATVAGVRIGTVRSRIARGRDRLRRALEDEDAAR